MTATEKLAQLTDDQKTELLAILAEYDNVGGDLTRRFQHERPGFLRSLQHHGADAVTEMEDIFRRRHALKARLNKLYDETRVLFC